MWFLPKQFFSLLVLWKCSLVPEGFDCSHRTRCSLYLSRAHQVLGRLPDTFFEPDTSITEYWDMRLVHGGTRVLGRGLENIVVIFN